MNSIPLRVTVWGENRHETSHKVVAKIYPNGMHEAIATGLREHLGDTVTVGTATLDQQEHGLSDDVLDRTDVLTWWGHAAHEEVSDDVVARIHERILGGMGLLVLHSGHYSKIFRRLMGTECGLRWREAAEREILWCVNPGHPIADGLDEYFELPHVEMYGEQFHIPPPDELIFISWFEGGEVFRSGCTWTRGKGKIFYFRPGHETFPIYYDANVQRVLANGVRWAAPASSGTYNPGGRNITAPLAPLAEDHTVDASIH